MCHGCVLGVSFVFCMRLECVLRVLHVSPLCVVCVLHVFIQSDDESESHTTDEEFDSEEDDDGEDEADKPGDDAQVDPVRMVQDMLDAVLRPEVDKPTRMFLLRKLTEIQDVVNIAKRDLPLSDYKLETRVFLKASMLYEYREVSMDYLRASQDRRFLLDNLPWTLTPLKIFTKVYRAPDGVVGVFAESKMNKGEVYFDYLEEDNNVAVCVVLVSCM